jgi:xanthine dehydrogenase accessory factor
MEEKLLKIVYENSGKGIRTALVTVISVNGSSPGIVGTMMVVDEKGITHGTVGGGNLEFDVVETAKKCIIENRSGEFEYNLDHDTELKMICGGKATVFIKIFRIKPHLLIVGGGHIGRALYDLAGFLDFERVIFDDREEYANFGKFPNAQKIYCGDVSENLSKYEHVKNSYVVIATRGHKFDRDALEAVVNKGYKYIGMIGSGKKVKETFNSLIESGVKKEELKKVYAPVGLGISSGEPVEIAFSIIAEILSTKNSGNTDHMKNIKKIKFD